MATTKPFSFDKHDASKPLAQMTRLQTFVDFVVFIAVSIGYIIRVSLPAITTTKDDRTRKTNLYQLRLCFSLDEPEKLESQNSLLDLCGEFVFPKATRAGHRSRQSLVPKLNVFLHLKCVLLPRQSY